MDLVTSIEDIEHLSEERREENIRFRAYLKGHLSWSDEKLDTVVHEIARSVSAEIDCTACANCCRTMRIGLEPEDIARLADHLGISAEQFESRYIADEGREGKELKQIPCPFLDGRLCAVYEDRPEACREFPRLDKEDTLSRSMGLIENAYVCPIVFNTLELLKSRLDWALYRY